MKYEVGERVSPTEGYWAGHFGRITQVDQITRAHVGRGLQLGTSLAVMGLPRWEH